MVLEEGEDVGRPRRVLLVFFARLPCCAGLELVFMIVVVREM